jgi:Nif-specific ferredoxin III
MPETQSADQSLTRDGRSWNPSYLNSIDPETCIGCGRCFKVCGQSVMTLRGLTGDGVLVDLDDDEEILRKVMTVTDAGACIGCNACSRVCGKNCQVHGTS